MFPEAGLTKLDLVRYYLAVAEGALRGVGGRPMVLKRFVKGIDRGGVLPEARAGRSRPDLVDIADAALRVRHVGRGGRGPGCRGAGLGRQPRLPRPQPAPGARRGPRPPRRAADRPRPDAGRRLVADRRRRLVARDVLDDLGLVGWPKTRGSRGLHIHVRIEPQWPFREVRLAAETVAREVESRAPDLATARWWKEERGESVFVDFNQNAKDRTVASAYSVRAAARRPGLDAAALGRGAATAGPEEFTLLDRARRGSPSIGDPRAGIDDAAGSLDALLALAERLGPAEKPPRGHRPAAQSTMPLIEVARTKTKPEALEALDQWKARHPDVVPRCIPPTCSSTGCAAAVRSGTGSGSTCSTSPRPSRPGAGAAGGRLRPVGRPHLARPAGRFSRRDHCRGRPVTRAREPDQTGFAVQDGVRSHYEVFGSGPVTVLLMPHVPGGRRAAVEGAGPLPGAAFPGGHVRPAGQRPVRPADRLGRVRRRGVRPRRRGGAGRHRDRVGVRGRTVLGRSSGRCCSRPRKPSRVRGLVAIAPGVHPLAPPRVPPRDRWTRSAGGATTRAGSTTTPRCCCPSRTRPRCSTTWSAGACRPTRRR